MSDPSAEHKHKNKPTGESMKPFAVTIAFRKNLGRRGGPPVWAKCERVEGVFAPDSTEAARIAQARTGARVVDCVCLWGN